MPDNHDLGVGPVSDGPAPTTPPHDPPAASSHEIGTPTDVRVTVAAYVVSRIPDNSPDHSVWSVRVEAAGHGRWAVRNSGRCLNKQGEWEYEPQPSSRENDWLQTVRWDDMEEAISAALAAEPHLRWNGLTPADVLARAAHFGSTEGASDG